MGILKKISLEDFDLDANFSSEEELMNVSGGRGSSGIASYGVGKYPTAGGVIVETMCYLTATDFSGDGAKYCFDYKTTRSECC